MPRSAIHLGGIWKSVVQLWDCESRQCEVEAVADRVEV